MSSRLSPEDKFRIQVAAHGVVALMASSVPGAFTAPRAGIAAAKAMSTATGLTGEVLAEKPSRLPFKRGRDRQDGPARTHQIGADTRPPPGRRGRELPPHDADDREAPAVARAPALLRRIGLPGLEPRRPGTAPVRLTQSSHSGGNHVGKTTGPNDHIATSPHLNRWDRWGGGSGGRLLGDCRRLPDGSSR